MKRIPNHVLSVIYFPKCLVWHTGGAAAPGGQVAGNPASAPAAAGGPNAQPLDMFAPQVNVSAVCCREVEKKPSLFLLFMSEGRVGGRFACQVWSMHMRKVH